MIAGGARPRLAPRARLHFDRHAGEWLLVYPERALALNETALAIVRLLDGAHTVDAIVRRLAGDSGLTSAQIDGDVRAFLDRLIDRRLLEAFA
jgi:pyrroloquinoline quinone biosynthesis protein D